MLPPIVNAIPTRSGSKQPGLHIGEKEVRRFEGMNSLLLAGINFHSFDHRFFAISAEHCDNAGSNGPTRAGLLGSIDCRVENTE
jgi:hypothetical protein